MGEDWPAGGARLAVRGAVALLALAGAGQAVVQAAVQAAGHGAGRTAGELVTLYGLPLCVLALASTLPLLLSPLPSAVVIAAANVLAFVSFTGPTVAGMVALIVAAGRLGAAGEARGGAALAPFLARFPAPLLAPFLALVLGLPFLVIAVAERGSVAAVLLAALVPVAAGAGLAVRSSRQAKTYSAAGEALAGTLVAHTARGERARIARELHDVVAHHISMIAVLAETGRLTTPGLPEAGARRFAEVGDTARAGLTEMRRLLGVLREDAADAVPAAEAAAGPAAGPAAEPAGVASRQPQPGLAQLAELIDAAREASGATARLIISGPVAPLDPGVELAAFRIVQEALTNARRHAAGAAIDVELRYAPDVLRLRVRDNGPGPGPLPTFGGHGLLGMRERASSAGGSLHTGAAAGGGFIVEAVLPAERDPAGHAAAALADTAVAGNGAGAGTASGASTAGTASGAGGRG